MLVVVVVKRTGLVFGPGGAIEDLALVVGDEESRILRGADSGSSAIDKLKGQGG